MVKWSKALRSEGRMVRKLLQSRQEVETAFTQCFISVQLLHIGLYHENVPHH